jgi:hypothetical protein
MKVAYSLIAFFAAYVVIVTAQMWRASQDHLGLTMAAAFIVIAMAAVTLACAWVIRLLIRRRR